MADLEIKQDNTKEWESAYKAGIARALETIGLMAESDAKKLCPVDTGRLRNSITHTTDELWAYIGTNVEYGPYIELGTSKMGAQPFLKPAAEQHGSNWPVVLKKELGGS